MKRFGWKPEYSVGNDEIDSEHKWLLSLANEIMTFSTPDEDLGKVKAAVTALYEYTKTHFKNEETFMADSGYEGLAVHMKLHEAIVTEMNRIMKQSRSLDLLVYKFQRLMKSWVLEHILKEDKKITWS